MGGNETIYINELEEDVQLAVWFNHSRGEITAFAVKLIYRGKEIVRYDNGHGLPHRDILYSGRKEWLWGMDVNDALTFAVEDMKANYVKYIERYERCLQRRKNLKNS